MKWIIYELRIWNQVKLWSSQLWTQFLQLRKEAWKIQDVNGIWTRDLAIPVQRSNQLSYDYIYISHWRWELESDVPVRNESTMKWCMKWIIYELRIWNQVKLWSSHLWTQFLNCVKKLENFRTSTGFEPVTSRYRCDALTNWAMKPLTLGTAFITARIIASLDFISAVHIWSISYIISSLIHSSREHWNPQMTSSQRQWLHSSVG